MEELLTVGDAARVLKLKSAQNFRRFAKRHGIPLVRLGAKVVRIRVSDLERSIAAHVDTSSLEDSER